MKRRNKVLAIAAAVIVTLSLSACGDLAAAHKAEVQCHQYGGKFSNWRLDDGSYNWDCDLSDAVKK